MPCPCDGEGTVWATLNCSRGTSCRCSTAYYHPIGGFFHFTAKERDDESGLDYFLARYYASSIGRFSSVDPMNAGAVPSLPQSWNGYSYVLNRPLSLIDPTGEVWVSSGGDYSWVDGDCPSGDAQCVSSLATVEQGGNVTVYARDGSRHTLTPNEHGVVSVVDLAAIPESGIEVGPQIQVENYLSPETAATFFNLASDYQGVFEGDSPLVFTGGSGQTGDPVAAHSTHRRGENVDMRYMSPGGESIRGVSAANLADVARTRFIVQGVYEAITSDPARFGSVPAGPRTLNAHRNHIHLIPFPGAGRRVR